VTEAGSSEHRKLGYQQYRWLIVFVMLPLLSACDWFKTREPEPGIGAPVTWSTLPGWSEDRLIDAWPAVLAQCPRMQRRDAQWQRLCAIAEQIDPDNEADVRSFLTTYFQPHEILGKGGKKDGLITGYYQPLLRGSRTASETYRYPIYKRPESLLKVSLDSLYPELKGKRVRGRIDGNRVVPFYSRAEIDHETSPLKGHELLWLDDPYASFFLQIQGSGKVQLDDGTLVGVNYADQNGHPYVSIGKKLIEWGELERDEVSLFTIRQWLEAHPQRAQALLNTNPSYVFFTLRRDPGENPRGSLNVPLTDLRSVAIDRKVIPLGSLLWLDTTLPDGQPLRRLMLAQDTGGAINGPVRADIFFGTGKRAEQLAGNMKQPGRVFILLPKQVADQE